MRIVPDIRYIRTILYRTDKFRRFRHTIFALYLCKSFKFSNKNLKFVLLNVRKEKIVCKNVFSSSTADWFADAASAWQMNSKTFISNGQIGRTDRFKYHHPHIPTLPSQPATKPSIPRQYMHRGASVLGTDWPIRGMHSVYRIIFKKIYNDSCVLMHLPNIQNLWISCRVLNCFTGKKIANTSNFCPDFSGNCISNRFATFSVEIALSALSSTHCSYYFY